MFDAVEIGRRISRLRKEKAMTQPALADKMGVSFQAVSNWERGASMPDIGKLPELAEALGVSVDELLGSGRGSELVKHVIDGSEEEFVEEKDVTLEEAGEAAPMLKPKQVTRIVRAINSKRERREKSAEGKAESFSIASLAAIAPFLDEDMLDELVEKLDPITRLGELAAIAPFLSEDALDRIAERAMVGSARIGEIASIAPFLSEDALDKIALHALDQQTSVGEIAAIAPFLSEEAVGKVALKALKNGGSASELAAIAPFMDEDALDRIVKVALRDGKSIGELAGLFPFLSRDTLRAVMESALSGGDTSILSKLGKFL